MDIRMSLNEILNCGEDIIFFPPKTAKVRPIISVREVPQKLFSFYMCMMLDKVKKIWENRHFVDVNETPEKADDVCFLIGDFAVQFSYGNIHVGKIDIK